VKKEGTLTREGKGTTVFVLKLDFRTDSFPWGLTKRRENKSCGDEHLRQDVKYYVWQRISHSWIGNWGPFISGKKRGRGMKYREENNTRKIL